MKPMTWQEATELIARMNEQGFDGHNDWRLPTVKELLFPIDYESAEPVADQLVRQGYDGVRANFYWSSSSYANYTYYAWSVCMYDGNVNNINKAHCYYVWPVRGELGFLKDLNSLDSVN